MPGNKKSGRKKKLVVEVGYSNENSGSPPQKRNPGRPRKLSTSSPDITGTDTPVGTTITNEVIELWDCSGIPRKEYEACAHDVKKVIERWVDAKEEDKTNHLYQKDLKSYLVLDVSGDFYGISMYLSLIHI